jgi:hypothetical protein
MGLKTECEQMKTKGVWTYGEMGLLGRFAASHPLPKLLRERNFVAKDPIE